MRGQGGRRGFGDMRVVGLERQHAMAAKPRRQPVDQEADVPLLLGTRVEVGGFFLGALDTACAKPDEIVAEPGIQRIGERIQLLAEQPFDHERIASGLAHLDCDAPHRAVGAKEGGIHAARAFVRVPRA